MAAEGATSIIAASIPALRAFAAERSSRHADADADADADDDVEGGGGKGAHRWLMAPLTCSTAAFSVLSGRRRGTSSRPGSASAFHDGSNSSNDNNYNSNNNHNSNNNNNNDNNNYNNKQGYMSPGLNKPCYGGGGNGNGNDNDNGDGNGNGKNGMWSDAALDRQLRPASPLPVYRREGVNGWTNA